MGLSSILHVGREPCIQPQLVQVLGDGVMFNQELKGLARLANRILYLLHSEYTDGGPIDLQDAVPRVDGIAVVGTDVHPVDPGPDKS